MLPDPVRAALAGALSLVFPTWCVGCDAPDVTLCAPCRAALTPVVAVRTVGGLHVHSGLTFGGVPARALRACKQEGRTALARDLAPALAAAVREALAAHSGGGAVAIVPVPATAAALRRRGYRVVEVLARRAALSPQRLLRCSDGAADQRGLSRSERGRNVAGSMHARDVRGRRVLIVDDIVTTGATLQEAARALTEAGATVVGAATVASTARATH